MYLLSLIFLCVFTALEASDKAFYAVTSLCCHLEQLTSEPDTDSIPFDETDVEKLWEKAATNPLYISDIQLARHYYHHASYPQTKVLLENVWEQLNTEILESQDTLPRGIVYPNYSDNPAINELIRSKTVKFLLPLNHPLKPILDEIFTKSRVNENNQTVIDAGFQRLAVKATSQIAVLKHPTMPGYLIKLYLENVIPNKNKAGWEWLSQRCAGAKAVRNLIKDKKLKHFRVANKWLYPLPLNPASTQNIKNQEIFALVVTDMNIVSYNESEYFWKHNITKSVLDELYVILSHGLASTAVILNEPPTKDGKFACIDTEHPKRNYDLKVVLQYLSYDMGAYWKKLVKAGGK